jgi:hypothetical protein
VVSSRLGRCAYASTWSVVSSKVVQADSHLRKLSLALEGGESASPTIGAPARLARIDDEPAFPVGNETVLG